MQGWSRRRFWLPGALLGLALTAHCVQSAQTYPMSSTPAAQGVTGQVQLEKVEGGQVLVVVELDDLPPPERVASGLTSYVVWLEDESGRRVNAGALRYDRAHRAGSLLATTDLTAFTVLVTGESDAKTDAPSTVLLAERKVRTH